MCVPSNQSCRPMTRRLRAIMAHYPPITMPRSLITSNRDISGRTYAEWSDLQSCMQAHARRLLSVIQTERLILLHLVIQKCAYLLAIPVRPNSTVSLGVILTARTGWTLALAWAGANCAAATPETPPRTTCLREGSGQAALATAPFAALHLVCSTWHSGRQKGLLRSGMHQVRL